MHAAKNSFPHQLAVGPKSQKEPAQQTSYSYPGTSVGAVSTTGGAGTTAQMLQAVTGVWRWPSESGLNHKMQCQNIGSQKAGSIGKADLWYLNALKLHVGFSKPFLVAVTAQ